jgi:hypothetical protein
MPNPTRSQRAIGSSRPMVVSFSFGDASFYGSLVSDHLNAPIAGMAAGPTDDGYWPVASDGGVFSLGDADYYGSLAERTSMHRSWAWPPPEWPGCWYSSFLA